MIYGTKLLFFYEMSFMKNKRCGKKDFGSKFVYLCGVFLEKL